MRGGTVIRCAIAFCILGVLFQLFIAFSRESQRHIRYGFTFSSFYAEHLGLQAQEVLQEALIAFHPDYVRLPLYWNVLEKERGVFSWEAADAAIERILASGAQVHLVLGAKVPRWPECFIPSWALSNDEAGYHDALLAYNRAIVERYANIIDIWQVENEAFFPFGICPKTDISLLEKEVALVRSLDPTARIQMTVSGEQQLWGSVALLADRIGVSAYRLVRVPLWGMFSSPLPPEWYRIMRLTLLFTGNEVVMSELQMEPWFFTDPVTLDAATAATLFTAQDALNNLAYAQTTGFSEISFWGVEWWYYMRQWGYPELWDTMEKVLK